MSDIDLPPLPELGRPFYGPDVQEYALSAIAPYKAEIERLKDQFHRMTMAHATECKKAEKAEAALAAECEVNFQHQAEIARHMTENAKLRELLREWRDPSIDGIGREELARQTDEVLGGKT